MPLAFSFLVKEVDTHHNPYSVGSRGEEYALTAAYSEASGYWYASYVHVLYNRGQGEMLRQTHSLHSLEIIALWCLSEWMTKDIKMESVKSMVYADLSGMF